MTLLILDVAGPSAVGAAAGLGFLLVLLGVAFVVFKLLKRTVKMAVRVAIVGVILLIAIVGSAWLFLSGPSKPQRPTPRPPITR